MDFIRLVDQFIDKKEGVLKEKTGLCKTDYKYFNEAKEFRDKLDEFFKFFQSKWSYKPDEHEVKAFLQRFGNAEARQKMINEIPNIEYLEKKYKGETFDSNVFRMILNRCKEEIISEATSSYGITEKQARKELDKYLTEEILDSNLKTIAPEGKLHAVTEWVLRMPCPSRNKYKQHKMGWCCTEETCLKCIMATGVARWVEVYGESKEILSIIKLGPRLKVAVDMMEEEVSKRLGG